jgi:hypothetical protein
MRRWEAWLFNVLNVILAVTGGAYFYMKHLLRNEDPFSVVNHPWQSSMLAAHVVAAPLGLILFGIVLRSHILTKLTVNGRPGRWTGWTSLVSFSAMALSGYLLQVVSSPAGLRAVMVAHVVTSAIFVLGYSAHLVAGWLFLRAPVLHEARVNIESRPHVP